MDSTHDVAPKPFYLFQIIPSYVLVFVIGVSCMVVAGFFLVEGLSHFSGGHTAQMMLIVGGILFQIAESSCFILAATTHHTWRIGLLVLGGVLFAFSIGVMTLAQKTALQTGEAHASAIDEKRQSIRAQIDSLDGMIASYRSNAESQSQSIYAKSRALGQDSLNRAARLEEKKMRLSDELFTLNGERRETSSDFFNRLEEVTGLPAQSTEFYFLVTRSLLLEICGVFFMAFGAFRRSQHLEQQPVFTSVVSKPVGSPSEHNRVGEGASVTPRGCTTKNDKIEDKDPTNLPLPNASDVFIEPEVFEVAQQSSAAAAALEPAYSNVSYLKSAGVVVAVEKIADQNAPVKKLELDDYVEIILTLKTEKKITSFGQRAIRNALAKYHDIKIGTDKARKIAELVKQRLIML